MTVQIHAGIAQTPASVKFPSYQRLISDSKSITRARISARHSRFFEHNGGLAFPAEASLDPLGPWQPHARVQDRCGRYAITCSSLAATAIGGAPGGRRKPGGRCDWGAARARDSTLGRCFNGQGHAPLPPPKTRPLCRLRRAMRRSLWNLPDWIIYPCFQASLGSGPTRSRQALQFACPDFCLRV